jgi:hypothetical protein
MMGALWMMLVWLRIDAHACVMGLVDLWG